jgi:hypothetical protein
VAVYEVIGEPPSVSGEFQETAIEPLVVDAVALVTVTFEGASGTVAGVTDGAASDAILGPTALTAVTLNE